MKSFKLAAACAAVVSLSNVVFAVDRSWDGSASGSWSNALNWSPAAVPGVGDWAHFSSGAVVGNLPVILDSNENVGTMSIDGISSIGAYAFQRTNGVSTLSVGNNLQLGFNAPANVTFIGFAMGTPELYINSGSTLNVTSNSQITDSNRFDVGGTLNVGSSTINTASISVNSIVNVNSGGVINTGAAGLLRMVSASGQLTINSGGTFNIGGAMLLGSGTMTVAANGRFTFNNSTLEIGSFLLPSGNFQFKLNQSYVLPSGKTIDISSGADFSTTDDLQIGVLGDGTLLLDGAGSSLVAGTNAAASYTQWGINHAATINFSNNATADFNRGLVIGLGAGGNARVDLTSGATLTADEFLVTGGSAGVASITISNNGQITSTGTTLFRSGTALELGSATLNLVGDATLSNSATIVQNGMGTILCGGDLNITSGASLTENSGDLHLVSGKSININAGTYTNNRTGGDIGLDNGTTMRITNGGKFNSTGYYSLSDAGGAFVSTLTIDGATSSLLITGSNASRWGTNAGNVATVNISNNAVATISRLDAANNNGTARVTLSSGGQLNVSALDFGGAAFGNASLVINGGALNIASTGRLAASTAVALSAGTFSINGNSTFTSGSTVNITGGTFTIGSGKVLTLTGGLVNDQLSGYALGSGATVRINSGTFTNAGTFNLGTTNGGTGTLAVTGASSRFITQNQISDWAAPFGGSTTVSFANSGIGTMTGVRIGESGGAANFSLASLSRFTTTSLLAGTNGTSGGVNVTVNNATLTVSGAAELRNGGVINYQSGTIGIGGNLTMSGTSSIAFANGSPQVLRAGGLIMSDSSAINLADDALIIDYTTPSPLTTIRGYLVSGRNAGAWTGGRIASSSAAADPTHRALGYGESSTILGAAGGTFAGEPVDGTAVLVRYTYLGDTNLDAKVDVADLGNLASHWQQSGGWSDGDFDYSGFIDVADLGALASNWQAGVAPAVPLGPTLAEALAAFGLPDVSVPEPITFPIAAAACGWAARRRRGSY